VEIKNKKLLLKYVFRGENNIKFNLRNIVLGVGIVSAGCKMESSGALY
jgi:hypothetical protein